MKVIAIVPIKSRSKRVNGKNFRILGGKPLYTYIIRHALEAGCFDEIYVDTDSEEIKTFCKNLNVLIIDREERMMRDDINGNDLLVHQMKKLDGRVSDDDLIFQLFCTAPFLKPETIKKSVIELKDNLAENDSIFIATEEKSFFWFGSQALNYNTVILPRSQNIDPLIKESTGLYGIKKAALDRYRCRIGANPIIKFIDPIEAVDMNVELDFAYAEFLIQRGLVLK